MAISLEHAYLLSMVLAALCYGVFILYSVLPRDADQSLNLFLRY